MTVALTSIRISTDFDSGNIQVLDAHDSYQLLLAIEPDTRSAHFQWFHFKAEGMHVGHTHTFRLSNAAAVRQALLAQIRESHCQLLPESQLPAMLAVQQQRDRRMAEALLAAAQPAMLLAGAYHVRRDVGVPLHLADLGGPAARVLILTEAGREVTAEQADYVWYSAAVEEQDYCASLRQR